LKLFGWRAITSVIYRITITPLQRSVHIGFCCKYAQNTAVRFNAVYMVKTGQFRTKCKGDRLLALKWQISVKHAFTSKKCGKLVDVTV